MAARAASWVWSHSRAANGSLIVLLAIADECGKEGHAEMTIAELARKSRLSERAVQNAVRDLTALGELSVTPGRGRGHRNSYALKGADSAPIPGGNPAESAPFTETPQNLHPLAEPVNPAESAPFDKDRRRSEHVDARNPAESAPFKISNESSGSLVSGKRSRASSSSEVAPRPDVDRLCAHLADRIEANGARRPGITGKWRDAARLLIDKDGRTEQQVHNMIDWCQDSEFWRSNIMSMPKLREKYDSLKMKAMAGNKPSGGRPNPDDDYANALRRIQARKENGNGTGGDGHDSAPRQIGLPSAADRRHNLRDLASRDRPPGLHRRAGRRHRHRPLGEILLSR